MKLSPAKFFVAVTLAIWLGATIAVDFVAIPSVFHNVSSLAQAGAVGMSVFSRFNQMEVAFAVMIFIFYSWSCRSEIKSRWAMISVALSFFLVILALSYLFYMTPQITMITQAKNNAFQESERLLLEQSLQVFHSLYIKLDSAKMIVIVALEFFIFAHPFSSKQKEEL